MSTDNQLTQPTQNGETKYITVVSDNPLMDTAKFEHLWRIACCFAKSDMVPTAFRAKPENCFVVIQFAMRCNMDPFAFLQRCYVIKGKPGIESTLAIALLDASGKTVGPIEYEFSGEGDDYGCTALVTDAVSRRTVVGPKVTLKIVKDDGWFSKDGSKWRVIPDLMFRYRAAMWLIRTTYPGVILGLSSREELEDMPDDVVDATPAAKPKTLAQLTPRIRERLEQTLATAYTIPQDAERTSPGETIPTQVQETGHGNPEQPEQSEQPAPAQNDRSRKPRSNRAPDNLFETPRGDGPGGT